MKKATLVIVSLIVVIGVFMLTGRKVDNTIYTWQNYSYRFYDENSIAILAYNNNDSADTLIVPAYVDSHKVRSIETGAFDCGSITSITISDSIDTLKENAFLHCDDVFFLSIGASLKTDNSFENLNHVQELVITYGKDGFMNDYKSALNTPYYASRNTIEKLTIVQGVRYLSEYSFSQLSALKQLQLASTIESLGKYCFAETLLQDTVFPYSLRSIGDGALSYDMGETDTTIVIPQAVTYIGENALSPFYSYCGYLDTIALKYLSECKLNYTPVSFEFAQKEITAELGEKISVVLNNSADFNDKIIYSSSDSDIASVDSNGIITPLSTGIALIGAKTETGYTTTKVAITHSSKNRAVYKLIGLNSQMKIDGRELFNSYNANTKMSFFSDNEDVIRVNEDGVVSGVALGKGEITVRYGLWNAKVVVEVTRFIEKIDTEETYYNLKKGQSMNLQPLIYPADAINKTLSYSSSDPDIALISKDGEIIGMNCGRCTITISSLDGSKTRRMVQVNVSDADITIERTSIIMVKGKSYQLTAFSNDGSPLSYNSLSNDIVSIGASGKMNAKSEGYCMINIQTQNESAFTTFECRVTDALYYGMDISQWNGRYNTVDTFIAAKNYGIDFTYIRACYGEDSEDKMWEKNYRYAKEAGLDVGAYHYIISTTVQDAIKEAQYMLTLLKGKQFEYPIAVDIEDSDQAQLDDETFNAIIQAYCDVLQNAGYKTVVYSYASLLRRVQGDYDYWMAHWGVLYPRLFTGGFTIWQYTSNGKVDGFSGRIDLDVCFFDYPTYMRENHLNGY